MHGEWPPGIFLRTLVPFDTDRPNSAFSAIMCKLYQLTSREPFPLAVLGPPPQHNGYTVLAWTAEGPGSILGSTISKVGMLYD